MPTRLIRRAVLRHARTVVATAAVAAGALVFPLSSTASADTATFRLENSTLQTLTLDSARVGTGKKCDITSVGPVDCPVTNPRDAAGQVLDPVIAPNHIGRFRIDAQCPPVPGGCNLRLESFELYWNLGTVGRVYVRSDGGRVRCDVIGPSSSTYECIVKPFDIEVRQLAA